MAIIDYQILDRGLVFSCNTGAEHPVTKRVPDFKPCTIEPASRVAALVGKGFHIQVTASNPLARRFYVTRRPGEPMRAGLPLRGERTGCGFVPEAREMLRWDDNGAFFEPNKPGLYVISWMPGGGLVADIYIITLTAANYRALGQWNAESGLHQRVANNLINDAQASFGSLVVGLEEDQEFLTKHPKAFPRIWGDCTTQPDYGSYGAPGYGQEDEAERQLREAKERAAEQAQLRKEQEELKARQEAARVARIAEFSNV